MTKAGKRLLKAANEVQEIAKDEPHEPGTHWAITVGPIVAKLHASSALGQKIEINSAGCLSLAQLLAQMARKLDEIEKADAQKVTH